MKMSIARHHTEWLSLTEVSGPFLSLPVLIRAFPQGLEKIDPALVPQIAAAYDEWREDQRQSARAAGTHQAWIEYVLRVVLGFSTDTIASGQAIPEFLKVVVAEHGETIRPTFVIRREGDNKSRLLVSVYPADQALGRRVAGKRWNASPETRMTELLHATGVRLGLVTNGEQWMLVDAPREDTAGFASWFAGLWLEERITLQAFRSILGASRFFGVAESDALEALLAESAQNQQEVTTQLGYQVRRAVEVLVDAFDRADQDHRRALLVDVPDTEIYEASLTVMMRLVFLFCAEERELLLLGDPLFDQHYAVSPLREQLRQTADQHGEEVLERRHDAWSRLLATFRAVHGGVAHERMTIPPYGGTLFDPDRFPFLEGRTRGTTWREQSADPLPVDNRTVLHLLEALQLLQVRVTGGGPAEARRLSFRALDIEQIGHVYEGLLDHTAKRATETTLGLAGTRSKNGDTEPEVPISKLEALAVRGRTELLKWVSEATGRKEKTLEKLLEQGLSAEEEQPFRVACGNGGVGEIVWQRVRPFAPLIRTNSFGHPLVIHSGSVHVTAGDDRRSTGTQYTRRSLTEPVVQYTLEPLVYAGPAEGKPREGWALRTPKELLALNICDFACGSGAFLVQACRYLSERLREAWDEIEITSPGSVRITPDGELSEGLPEERLIPKDADERVTYSMRLIAQRCLYGVDINPLAVEMAKLSMWLLTLARDQPFTFLDHAIRCGDSLLGITSIEQLKRFSLSAGPVQRTISQTETFDQLIDDAISDRLKLETMESSTTQDVQAQERLLNTSLQRLELLKTAADQLIASEMGETTADDAIRISNAALRAGAPPQGLKSRRLFHWPLEFPEVVCKRGGFDAFVGNPPFITGTSISTILGTVYKQFLKQLWPHLEGRADICVIFMLRGAELARSRGTLGFIASNTTSETDSRLSGPARLLENGFQIYRAVKSMPWPGSAAVFVCQVHYCRGEWHGPFLLDGTEVRGINSSFEEGSENPEPFVLADSKAKSFTGTKVYGNGFVLSKEEAEEVIREDTRNRNVVKPYLIGKELNDDPECRPVRYIVDFTGLSASDAQQYARPWRIVSERVYEERQSAPEQRMREVWWQFQRPRLDLYSKLARSGTAWLIAATSDTIAFVGIPFLRNAPAVFSHAMNVLVLEGFGDFASVQSSIHLAWARRYGSSLKGDFRYTTTDCLETFPFPTASEAAEEAGRTYHEQRHALMLVRGEGLTKTYNRFHSRGDTSADIQELRDLHVVMDRAVMAAYGWSALELDHGFHETKQGMRFTISEPARRKVLDLLLQLNHQRHLEEMKKSMPHKAGGAKKTGRKKNAAPTVDEDPTLFG